MGRVVPFDPSRAGTYQPASQPVETGGGPPHDGGMEVRIARLESDVEYIKRDVAEIRTTQQRMLDKLEDFGKDVNAEFKAVRSEMREDLKYMLGAMAAAVIGLAGIMAAGFGWL